jgi:hypothetical protein
VLAEEALEAPPPPAAPELEEPVELVALDFAADPPAPPAPVPAVDVLVAAPLLPHPSATASALPAPK